MPDPVARCPDIPEDLVTFIQRAGAKNPEERFGSCAEAAEFLRVASELPLVDALDLATLSIVYHPTRKAAVQEALQQLKDALAPLTGVKLRVAGS
jgi:hypothetical protein